jgi:hypothetical protein
MPPIFRRETSKLGRIIYMAEGVCMLGPIQTALKGETSKFGGM